jgi:hypothetical protein
MKIKLLSLLAGLLLAPLAVHAADFEGKIGMKMTSGGRSTDMTYAVKGGKLRMEMPGGQGAMVMDPAKKETTMIMDQQKMYMVMPVPEVQPQAETGKAGEAPKLEKTGQTEKILGYTAEKYIVTQDEQKTEMWLAEGLGTFMNLNSSNPMAGMGRRGGGAPANMQAWEKALAGKSLFPMRVVGRDKADKETFRMEVTSVDKNPLSDSLFAPPASYQKFDMGAMMQGAGMPGMPGMPGGARPPGGR